MEDPEEQSSTINNGLIEAAKSAEATQAQQESGAIGTPETRDLKLGESLYTTNLPAGTEVWVRKPNGVELTPYSLDELPVGEYFAELKDSEYDLKHSISIRESEKGKVIPTSVTNWEWSLPGNSGNLMQSLGFETADGQITAIPTPETVESAAALFGVDIKFFPDQDYIAGEDYLQAFAEGKYPASSDNLERYLHDIEDDHLTGMVLGGEPLKEALKIAASKQINQGSIVDTTAGWFDVFTAAVRGSVAPTRLFSGRQEALKTLTVTAKALDIPQETMRNIVETAMSTARTLALDVYEN